MKTFKLTLIYLTLLMIFSSCSKDEGVDTDPNTSTANPQSAVQLSLAQESDWPFALEILQLINEHRRTLELNDLAADRSHATALAVEHAHYMIAQGKISHNNFAYRSNILKNLGAVSVGENVAYGYSAAETLVQAWLNSPSHRQVIEGPYTDAGFGIIEDERGVYYFTMLVYRD